MIRSRLTPLLFGIAALLFFIAGLLPRIDGEPMNTTNVALGVAFTILAAGHFRRSRVRERATTDPRMPAAKSIRNTDR